MSKFDQRSTSITNPYELAIKLSQAVEHSAEHEIALNGSNDNVKLLS